jgi:hypothetical protein
LKSCWQDMRARSLSGGEAGELSAQLSPRLERQLYVDTSRIAQLAVILLEPRKGAKSTRSGRSTPLWLHTAFRANFGPLRDGGHAKIGYGRRCQLTS